MSVKLFEKNSLFLHLKVLYWTSNVEFSLVVGVPVRSSFQPWPTGVLHQPRWSESVPQILRNHDTLSYDVRRVRVKPSWFRDGSSLLLGPGLCRPSENCPNRGGRGVLQRVTDSLVLVVWVRGLIEEPSVWCVLVKGKVELGSSVRVRGRSRSGFPCPEGIPDVRDSQTLLGYWCRVQWFRDCKVSSRP